MRCNLDVDLKSIINDKIVKKIEIHCNQSLLLFYIYYLEYLALNSYEEKKESFRAFQL